MGERVGNTPVQKNQSEREREKSSLLSGGQSLLRQILSAGQASSLVQLPPHHQPSFLSSPGASLPQQGNKIGLLSLPMVDVDIATHIEIYDDGPERSLLVVESADRPGLLVDLVKIIADINITVQSGEFDTEGLLAKAKFHVSYRGKPLIKALQQVLANSLRYFLRRPTTEDASF